MKKILSFLVLILSLTACTKTKITIGDFSKTSVGHHASAELVKYLSKVYPSVDFEAVRTDSDADIQLFLSDQAKELGKTPNDLPTADESFKIVQVDGNLLIVSPDERGLLNAVYALLEKQGFGFYIGGDVAPKPREWAGFEGWKMEDGPILDERSLFNWHNFLSGCTGWNLDDWKLWIDQANKMRYNAIMVHAYGNNPMFSYDYLGETKTTGYLNNSDNGRDWGNQHINNVRRMTGGEIFDAPVYGAKPSLATEETKVAEVTEMMHDAFEYARQCGTKVIFALDFDTWMSHPQNIVSKLPNDAVFEISGHLTPNPEHPEGYKYYKHQLQELLIKYPQIDELTAWSRAPSNKTISVLGTIWMAFSYEKFPEAWKKEYDIILQKNPTIENDLRAQGMFAFSKIVSALKKAAKELKPELVIGYGSWSFDWLNLSDVFMPKKVPFRPLDTLIDFNSDKSKNELAKTGVNRDLYPIVWAHHDDFAYIGRPYIPYENLSDLAKERQLKGLGIIHWTTHPLDIYFTGTAKQLWTATANQPIQTTVDEYVHARFGTESKELSAYFKEWITNGPIFGRETSDHFIDLGKLHWKSKLKPWNELVPEAQKRIEMLELVPENIRNSYWNYQKGMEEFYISFFENQVIFTSAYNLTEAGKVSDAKLLMKSTTPEETISRFVSANKNIGFTAGEEALVISLNTRWLPDFTNLKQRLGLEPVRIKFAPTKHDPLAQVPGVNTYEIDEEGNWWICFWKNELPECKFAEESGTTVLLMENESTLKLASMHGQDLAMGDYQLVVYTDGSSSGNLSVFSEKKQVAKIDWKENAEKVSVQFRGGGENLKIVIDTLSVRIKGIEIMPIK